MTAPDRRGKVLLTVDVEEWFHAPEHRFGRDEARWGDLSQTLPDTLPEALDLLAGLGVRATFFVLGWAAARHPALVRRIAEAGHEVGCHGWGHRRADRDPPGVFRADLLQGKAAVEDAVSGPVDGYRAPRWSLPAAPWPYEILAEAGFAYSSSRLAVPGLGWRPGRAPRRTALPELEALRFPGPWGAVPAGGTVALRLLPLPWLRRATAAAVEGGRPAVLWFHPWELAPEGPRLDGGPFFRWARYARLGILPDRIRALVPAGDRRLLPYVEGEASRTDPGDGAGGLDGRAPKGP